MNGNTPESMSMDRRIDSCVQRVSEKQYCVKQRRFLSTHLHAYTQGNFLVDLANLSDFTELFKCSLTVLFIYL